MGFETPLSTPLQTRGVPLLHSPPYPLRACRPLEGGARDVVGRNLNYTARALRGTSQKETANGQNAKRVLTMGVSARTLSRRPGQRACLPAAEDAFRRGFQQGHHAALQAVARGVPARRIARWCMEVYRWRFLRTHKKPIPPPLVKEK